MITKTRIVLAYSRYLDSIKQCDGGEIPSKFGKLTNWLNSNVCNLEEDDKWFDFYWVVLIDSIGKTIAQLKKKEVRLKEVSESWSSIEVKECYRLVKLINQSINNNRDQFSVNWARFCKLTSDTEDIALRLYMYMTYRDSYAGEGFFSQYYRIIPSLFKAETDEEIDKIIQDFQKGSGGSTIASNH